MKLKASPIIVARHPSSPDLLKVLLCLALAGLPSCGPKDNGAAGAGQGGSPAAGGAADAGSAAVSPGKTAVVVIEPKPINLKTLPVFDGGELLGRSPANVTYKAKGDVKAVYEHHKKQFLALGWKEAPDASVTGQSASGAFTGAGYKISSSVYSVGTPGEINVMLHNHGDIDLAKLPLPPGTKPVYVGLLGAMHVTEASVADTIEAIRKLLASAGWEPHGNEGDSWHFKQGLNRISATVSSAPAQGGKTMISYGSELMSGDLPAPPDAQDLRYVDSQQKLTFDTTGDKDAVVAYYKQALAKTGWKPNREETYQIDDKDEMVFRNGDGIIFLEVRREYQGKRLVTLGYNTITEMDEAAARIKKKVAAEKQAEMAKEAGKPSKPRVSIALPDGASGVERTKNGIKFTVGNGKAKAVVEGWQKQFRDAGWKEDAASLSAMAGMLSLSRGNQHLSASFNDTGFTPAEVEVSVTGAEMEQTGAAK